MYPAPSLSPCLFITSVLSLYAFSSGCKCPSVKYNTFRKISTWLYAGAIPYFLALHTALLYGYSLHLIAMILSETTVNPEVLDKIMAVWWNFILDIGDQMFSLAPCDQNYPSCRSKYQFISSANKWSLLSKCWEQDQGQMKCTEAERDSSSQAAEAKDEKNITLQRS